MTVLYIVRACRQSFEMSAMVCDLYERRVSSVVEHSSADLKVPGSIRSWSHTRVMDYDESCFMHLTPGVVHNFQKAVGL